jgi:hypothetical protein
MLEFFQTNATLTHEKEKYRTALQHCKFNPDGSVRKHTHPVSTMQSKHWVGFGFQYNSFMATYKQRMQSSYIFFMRDTYMEF